MGENQPTWLIFLAASTLTLTTGLLFLDGSAWYVQYPVLGVALALAVLGLLRADTESSAT